MGRNVPSCQITNESKVKSCGTKRAIVPNNKQDATGPKRATRLICLSTWDQMCHVKINIWDETCHKPIY